MNIRILHSCFKAQYAGDTRNTVLQDPYSCVVFLDPMNSSPAMVPNERVETRCHVDDHVGGVDQNLLQGGRVNHKSTITTVWNPNLESFLTYPT